jgi:secreted PhoX family phosphatase
VRKAQAAHGISVIEVEQQASGWQVVRPSRYARRITANTPFAIGGPAAGHALMKTAADPAGRTVLGTINNCASGKTPWGTYLSGEENWANYFTAADTPTAHERRWGIRKATWYRWPEFDPLRHRAPPQRVPTALAGSSKSTRWTRTARRQAHRAGPRRPRRRLGGGDAGRARGGLFGRGRALRVHLQVCQPRPHRTGRRGKTARKPTPTCWTTARCTWRASTPTARGRWLPLVHGQGPLTAANGFADQGEVLIKARQASDLLGATKMDRPEWLAIDPASRWVYCTLTNNSARGAPGQARASTPPTRAPTTPWARSSAGARTGDFDGDSFEWNHLLLAGDPANERPEARGNIRAMPSASPDTAWPSTRAACCGSAPTSARKRRQGRNGAPGQQPAAGLRPGHAARCGAS